jgi:diadenylate cyclase
MGWEVVRFALDALVLAFLIYEVITFFRGTRAVHAIGALAVLLLLFLISNERFLGLTTINLVLSNFMGGIAVLVVVLYQDDLRRALMRLAWLPKWLGGVGGEARSREHLEEVVEAVKALASRRVGALIVLEQKADLRPFEKGSIPLDAALDRNLLFLLFVPAFENPTHDGAVLVRGNRIVAAHCILPLAQVVATDRAFGTRHRAALGLAEQTDALVIVVSEETGRISVAWNGHLERGLAPDRLREILITASAQQQAGESVPWRPPVAAPATPAAPAAPAPTQHSSQGKPTP